MEGREESKGKPTDGTLEQYVATLRWSPTRLRDDGRVYLKIGQIAKIVKVSPSKVRCLLAYARGDRPRQPQDRCSPPAKIQPHHVVFLTSMSTLQAQAACTLTERAVLLHRRFPEIKISPNSIQRLYRMNGIRRKALRYVKTLKYQDPERRQLDIRRMKTEIWQARE
jgi:ribosomal protein S15P/S13E